MSPKTKLFARNFAVAFTVSFIVSFVLKVSEMRASQAHLQRLITLHPDQFMEV